MLIAKAICLRIGMDYLESIARVTSHIPDRGQVMVRYYGLL
ncbi:MAG: transposase [Candidatus Aminicenantaceae bacterium]